MNELLNVILGVPESKRGCSSRRVLVLSIVISGRIQGDQPETALGTLEARDIRRHDSVSHIWLLQFLELYEIDMNLTSFLEACMGQWVAVLRHLRECDIPAASEAIRINRG